MNNMRNKILSLLVLLLTVAAGAWADDTYTVKFEANGNSKTIENVTLPKTWACDYGSENGELDLIIKEFYADACCSSITPGTSVTGGNGKVTVVSSKNQSITITEPFEGTATVTGDYLKQDYNVTFTYSLTISITGNVAPEPPIEVKPVAGQQNQWEFDMPASNVVLTPRYASATIYDTDGQTEKMAYETLKEAIQNVQNGETIKLDWDVTFTAQDDPIETSDEGEGVTFTLDLNGYTIDGTALEDPCIVLNNPNDQMTITDSKLTGGIKGIPATGAGAIIFDGGRYFFNTEVNAENIMDEWANYASVGWQLADGKEFVDIENGPDEKGFTLRVDYKTFELTIGAGRFATFYANENVSLTEGENIGFYTISSINDDRTKANVAPINSTIIPASIPTLVYNGDDDQQTVKLKATTDAVNLTVDHAPEFLGTATDREFTATDMAAADYYALSGGKIFVPVLDAGILAANQCWLQFDHGQQLQSGARSIKLVFEGETTGVSEELRVKSEEFATAQWYTIDGRKVATPNKKGVYIQNGKKVVK